MQTNNKLKYLFGFVIIIGAIIYLLSTSFRSSLQFYLTVSELQANDKNYSEKTLKLAGKAHGIQQTQKEKGSVYTFTVEEGGKTISVIYEGMVPDTFKEGSDVVVTGKLRPDGVFEATDILAKCASKYEAKVKP